MCIRNNQATCTYDDSCYLLINTGQEIIDSENGLLATWPFNWVLKKNHSMPLLADICGITIERPQTSSPSCLGAMLAAGSAMKVLNLNDCLTMLSPPSDIFHSTMCASRKLKSKQKFTLFITSEFIVRDIKYRRWKRAIKKCLNWDTWGSNDDISAVSYEDRGKLVKLTVL